MTEEIIYRKIQNGAEFMKIVNKKTAISFYNTRLGNLAQVTTNSMTIRDYMDDSISMPSTEMEFLNAYNQFAAKFLETLLKK